MRSEGVGPSRPLRTTRPSTVRVYRFTTITQSRHPVPTRVTRLTRAGPQPCAAAKLETQGSNLDFPDSESGVLPDYTSLHWYGRGESNAHPTGFEPAASAIGLRPRAPPRP